MNPANFCDCGERKSRRAKKCLACTRSAAAPPTVRQKQQTGLASVGRSESIITFTRASTSRSLQCYGPNAAAQIAYGLRQLEGDDWEVSCRSTPTTIFNDLHAAELTARGMDARLANIERVERIA